MEERNTRMSWEKEKQCAGVLSEELHDLCKRDLELDLQAEARTEGPSLQDPVKVLFKMFDFILRAIGNCLKILSRKANMITFVI